MWDKWSDIKGINKTLKENLIETANAAETFKTWYVSEEVVPIEEIIEIKNMLTDETLSVNEALKRLPKEKPLEHKCTNVIDDYILNQLINLQVLLLNVRLAIKQALPNATEKISYQMPTFWQGRNLIHFAAHKNHIGIYPGAEAVEHFALRLTDYKTSKGAIQFPYNSFGAEQIKLISEIAAWCGKDTDKSK